MHAITNDRPRLIITFACIATISVSVRLQTRHMTASFAVRPDQLWLSDTASVRCALGRGGLIACTDKREGDGCTPMGSFRIKQVLYRADRLTSPDCRLPIRPLEPHDGWCDAPDDAAHYNRHVCLPHPSSHENLWRDDHGALRPLEITECFVPVTHFYCFV